MCEADVSSQSCNIKHSERQTLAHGQLGEGGGWLRAVKGRSVVGWVWLSLGLAVVWGKGFGLAAALGLF